MCARALLHSHCLFLLQARRRHRTRRRSQQSLTALTWTPSAASWKTRAATSRKSASTCRRVWFYSLGCGQELPCLPVIAAVPVYVIVDELWAAAADSALTPAPPHSHLLQSMSCLSGMQVALLQNVHPLPAPAIPDASRAKVVILTFGIVSRRE